MKPELVIENMRIPKVFFDDHCGRDLTVTERLNEDGYYSAIVKETKQHFYVSLTKEEFDDLLDDAKHYVWMSAHGEYGDLPGLIRSARATIKAMTKSLEAK